MADDPLIRISFVGFALHMTLQGFFLAIASLSMYFMFRRRVALHRCIFSGAVILVVGVTAHWCLSFAQMYTLLFSAHMQNPVTYLLNTSEPLCYAKMVTLFMVHVTTDLLIIHRLYTVWQGKTVVFVPPLVLLTGIVAAKTGGLICFLMGRFAGNIIDDQFVPWLLTMLGQDVLLHSYCTAMIAWRIWQAGSCTKRFGGPRISESFVIFVESAALYLTYDIVLLSLYIRRHPACMVVLDLGAEIAAMAYMLISVRVCLGIARAGSFPQSGLTGTIPQHATREGQRTALSSLVNAVFARCTRQLEDTEACEVSKAEDQIPIIPSTPSVGGEASEEV